MPAEDIEKIEETYGVDLYEMLKNVRECNNGDADTTKVYLSPSKYPPCYFGLAHVQGGSGEIPISHPTNEDDLPDWIYSGVADIWDEPHEKKCELHPDYPVCSY